MSKPWPEMSEGERNLEAGMATLIWFRDNPDWMGHLGWRERWSLAVGIYRAARGAIVPRETGATP